MQNIVSETLNLLEQRLARLQFYLGSSDEAESNSNQETSESVEPVNSRMAKLEGRFSEVCSKFPTTQKFLNLSVRFPELSGPEEGVGSMTPSVADQKQQVLLSSTSVFSRTHSGLNALGENSVPDAEPVAALVAMKPRLQRARATQQTQLREIQALQERSAILLLQWYKNGVLENGETWANVEDRLTKIEQMVRRREVALAREQSEI